MTSTSDNPLLRFLSIENMASLVVIAFVFGMGYNALAEESAGTKKRVAIMEQEQKQLLEDVHTIQTDVAVIKNNQGHVREKLEEQKERTERILFILESGQ